MKHILIAGGSGYVGRHLTLQLMLRGYKVSWLSRDPIVNNSIKQYKWNYKTGEIELEALANADVLVNLAGAPINGQRWNKKYKQEIQDSRVDATQFLLETLKTNPNNINTYIQASAIGFYGYTESITPHSEKEEAGEDFLATTCRLWEEKAQQFEDLNIRTCVIRTGIVFNPGSEAFTKLTASLRFHIAAIIGTGKQYFPWVHIDDLCYAYFKMIIDNRMQGTYNIVAPEQVTNEELTKAMARHYSKKTLIFKIPAFIIRVLFGEIANSMLSGGKISSVKIITAGFKFHYNSVGDLLAQNQMT